ncbi:MAG: 3-deoxy-8-phosphooctulonate synthase [Parachlamydiales bacterium]
MHTVKIKSIRIGLDQPLAFMCGPCVIESREHALQSAEFLQKTFAKKNIPLIYKSSYDKANRSSISSFRGLGMDEGLRILETIKKEFDLPIVTDVHTIEEARAAGNVVDILQIPAFLCRQTDLLVAAAETGAVVSVKKGQFMAPWDMGNVVEKIRASGNPNIILVERGASFGYNTLVTDLRSLPIMQSFGVPVCFDATHSVQQPGGLGTITGGQREYVPLLARAAVAAGVQCVFLETHNDPARAPSDAANMLPHHELPALLDQLIAIHAILHTNTPHAQTCAK